MNDPVSRFLQSRPCEVMDGFNAQIQSIKSDGKSRIKCLKKKRRLAVYAVSAGAILVAAFSVVLAFLVWVGALVTTHRIYRTRKKSAKITVRTSIEELLQDRSDAYRYLSNRKSNP